MSQSGDNAGENAENNGDKFDIAKDDNDMFTWHFPKDFDHLTKPELVVICEERGLRKTGSKNDLIDRILLHNMRVYVRYKLNTSPQKENNDDTDVGNDGNTTGQVPKKKKALDKEKLSKADKAKLSKRDKAFLKKTEKARLMFELLSSSSKAKRIRKKIG